jgi:hypothetical protein
LVALTTTAGGASTHSGHWAQPETAQAKICGYSAFSFTGSCKSRFSGAIVIVNGTK